MVDQDIDEVAVMVDLARSDEVFMQPEVSESMQSEEDVTVIGGRFSALLLDGEEPQQQQQRQGQRQGQGQGQGQQQGPTNLSSDSAPLSQSSSSPFSSSSSPSSLPSAAATTTAAATIVAASSSSPCCKPRSRRVQQYWRPASWSGLSTDLLRLIGKYAGTIAVLAGLSVACRQWHSALPLDLVFWKRACEQLRYSRLPPYLLQKVDTARQVEWERRLYGTWHSGGYGTGPREKRGKGQRKKQQKQLAQDKSEKFWREEFINCHGFLRRCDQESKQEVRQREQNGWTLKHLAELTCRFVAARECKGLLASASPSPASASASPSAASAAAASLAASSSSAAAAAFPSAAASSSLASSSSAAAAAAAASSSSASSSLSPAEQQKCSHPDCTYTARRQLAGFDLNDHAPIAYISLSRSWKNAKARLEATSRKEYDEDKKLLVGIFRVTPITINTDREGVPGLCFDSQPLAAMRDLRELRCKCGLALLLSKDIKELALKMTPKQWKEVISGIAT
eukprot:g39108.t1